MLASVALPDGVAGALEVWLRHHDGLAPGLIEGLYVVGSVALDDWRPTSDVDIVGVTATPVDESQVELLREAAARARAEIGQSPVIDGPLLTWADLAAPTTSAVRPWTLDGEFHHDDGCFELHPVTWLTLARHGVSVRGPAADELDVPVDPDAVSAFVRANMDDYWMGVREQVAAALAADPARTTFSAEMTEWCVLGIARMAFTLATGGVASKTRAGEWALEHHPEHSGVIAQALAIRDGAGPVTVGRDDVASVVAWMTDADTRIRSRTA